jgi:hypothetical protein
MAWAVWGALTLPQGQQHHSSSSSKSSSRSKTNSKSSGASSSSSIPSADSKQQQHQQQQGPGGLSRLLSLPRSTLVQLLVLCYSHAVMGYCFFILQVGLAAAEARSSRACAFVVRAPCLRPQDHKHSWGFTVFCSPQRYLLAQTTPTLLSCFITDAVLAAVCAHALLSLLPLLLLLLLLLLLCAVRTGSPPSLPPLVVQARASRSQAASAASHGSLLLWWDPWWGSGPTA